MIMRMDNFGKQALIFAANLSLPTFQVIVLKENLGSPHCRQKVTQVISKMAGSKGLMVDISKKEVIVRGDMKSSRKEVLKQNKTESRSVVKCLFEFLIRTFLRIISFC
ncbi:hypothetical protein ABFX02_01G092900 [Erythranthe guttata]